MQEEEKIFQKCTLNPWRALRIAWFEKVITQKISTKEIYETLKINDTRNFKVIDFHLHLSLLALTGIVHSLVLLLGFLTQNFTVFYQSFIVRFLASAGNSFLRKSCNMQQHSAGLSPNGKETQLVAGW